MSIFDQLQQNFPKLDFKDQHSLTRQTYAKIGGEAEVYLELSQRNDIVEVIAFVKKMRSSSPFWEEPATSLFLIKAFPD